MPFVRQLFPDFHHDVPILPERQTARNSRIPYFFLLNGNEDLSTILRRPYNSFMEIGERSRLETAITRMNADTLDFALSLTTESTYHNDIAGMVTAALHDRFGISDALQIDIETCLREALINAVVHGNLSLETCMKSREDFEAYYTAIEERIGKALYKIRRVNIAVLDRNQHLELRVSDEGQGFTFDINAADILFPHSRGLFLIHSLADNMWVADDRRTLCMTFRR